MKIASEKARESKATSSPPASDVNNAPSYAAATYRLSMTETERKKADAYEKKPFYKEGTGPPLVTVTVKV